MFVLLITTPECLNCSVVLQLVFELSISQCNHHREVLYFYLGRTAGPFCGQLIVILLTRLEWTVPEQGFYNKEVMQFVDSTQQRKPVEELKDLVGDSSGEDMHSCDT